MSIFRDNDYAQKVKSETQHRDFLEALRKTKEEDDRQRALQAKLHEYEEMERKLRGGPIRQFFNRFGRERPADPLNSYYGGVFHTGISPGLKVAALMGLLVAFACLLIYYHEEYGIREGYVMDKTYTPAHYTYSTDSHGHVSSTYHPDDWSITVTIGDESSSWSVGQEYYESVGYHEWACVPSFGYRCQGEPTNPDFFTPEHFTVYGEENGVQ